MVTGSRPRELNRSGTITTPTGTKTLGFSSEGRRPETTEAQYLQGFLSGRQDLDLRRPGRGPAGTTKSADSSPSPNETFRICRASLVAQDENPPRPCLQVQPRATPYGHPEEASRLPLGYPSGTRRLPLGRPEHPTTRTPCKPRQMREVSWPDTSRKSARSRTRNPERTTYGGPLASLARARGEMAGRPLNRCCAPIPAAHAAPATRRPNHLTVALRDRPAHTPPTTKRA